MSEPASSSAFCPACGTPIDALRAGQVAILGGAFRYFCDATCKSAFVDRASMRPTLDAMTAEPPPVASAPRTIASGVRAPIASDTGETTTRGEAREAGTNEAEPFFPDPTPFEYAITAQLPPVAAEAYAATEPRVLAREEPPHTLRSPSTPDIEVSAPRQGRVGASTLLAALVAHLVAAAPVVGVLAGALAAVISIAGPGAGALRLPLALLATAIVLARKLVVPLAARGEEEVSAPLGSVGPWTVVAPILVAAVVATLSTFNGDPHADAHASFCGLAAAAALAVDVLLSRARRDIVEMRQRTTAGLAVTARVVRGDDTVVVAAAQVKPGEQVIVEPGETIPVDGVVATGEAQVAPWLDSPILSEKREGDAVVAGAVVASGSALRVNATFTGSERAWLRLIRPSAPRIEVAAPLVAFIRKMIARGSPLAGLLVAGAVYASNGALADVILTGCAGAYALSVTAAATAAALAHARGHAAAQRRGIVYKDAVAFDAAARADVAVVCSRGTILLGEPEIVAVEAMGANAREDRDRVLAVAAGAELSSNHPFAAAVLREARARSVRPESVRSPLVHAGLGVTALAGNGDRVLVGSRAFLLQEKVSVAIADARTTELEAEGRSVLLVAVGGRLAGLLGLQDGLRPGARASVQRLHDARIEPVLLSGEARETCETIARALDIEHVRPEILPSDRGAEVRALGDGGHVVAALGHAASDDGALGAADVSVAMLAAGAAPGEWSVALASDDVRDAALALTIPRASRERARTAVVVGALAQALGSLGIVFGVAPPAIVPVLGVLTAVAVVAVVRDGAQVNESTT